MNLFPFKNPMSVMQNPQGTITQMIMNNPNMKQAVDYINANGGDPKTAFYKLAQEKGVDPDEFLKQCARLK